MFFLLKRTSHNILSMKAQCALFVIPFALLIFPFIGNASEPVFIDSVRSLVYEIAIEKQIEPALLYVIRRGVREAVAAQADAIVFTMNTPGGRVDVARDILEVIRDLPFETYTFVQRDAYSAGAIIALGTQHIYMAPGSVIGAATPLMMSPSGSVQNLNEDVGEKIKSGVAAMARAAAEQGGHDPELAEAMVRRETEYIVGTHVVSEAGKLLTLTANEANGILSDGTVENLDAMLNAAGLANAKVIVLEVSPAEHFARMIASIAPILMMIGLGGIYLEFKTPGFGLPGIVGAIALTLFFFGHHIAGLAGMGDMILFVVGILLLLIEIMIIPGFGVIGISGFALILISLLNAMSWKVPGELLPVFSGSGATLQQALINLAWGMSGAVVLGFFAGKYLPKSKLIQPLVLTIHEDKAEGFCAAHDHTERLGEEGVTKMNLRPSGRARFDNRSIDVITHGEFIEKGVAVRIVEIHGTRIVVEKI